MSQTPTTAAASSRFQAIFNLQSCDSISAILAVLRDQVREFDQVHNGDERLTKWLIPTVNVLYAFSAAVSEGVGLVFSAKVIFAGIGAAKDVAASKDTLAELFECIGFFFNRLETYTEVTPTAAMTIIITKIMVEVLMIFGIATKELSTEKKLAGRTDLEDAVKKLDRLTQEEARMALAEVLKITHIVHDGVKVVDGKVESMDDKVEDMGGKVDDMPWATNGEEAKLIIQQMASNLDEVKWNQIRQLLRTWLSPADPSTNHNTARKAQHKGTAAWFFGSIVVEWKSTGSLLWIYGKPGSGKSIICSSVIQDIMAVCEAGSAIMAYFYFVSGISASKLVTTYYFLSYPSFLLTLILTVTFSTAFTRHTKTALDSPGPIFIVLDALDECPDSSGIPSPRDEVLQLVKELVNLDLQGLRICATSRPEVDIRAVLESLAFLSVSLHDESGQQSDIADYVRNVVNSSPSSAMRRWRADDKNLVIETLTERANGMFRWVFCQLEALRHCFPQNLRQFLNELPESLDETYERILTGITKAQKDNAHRLLQCLAVAVRPLRVEELAEILAFDFQASSSGGIPKLKDDWRWDDQEEAVLSTCSSLIVIVPDGDSRVVQFSHFSVKEYLISPRLAQSHGDVFRFHIDLDAAHTILAQACLGTLLRLDEHLDVKVFPLVEYAAEHWVDHAQFEEVSLRVRHGMEDLFDSSKPHFAAWLRVHDIDEGWTFFSPLRPDGLGSPLYYAAFCGFYDLAESLITEHPEQVNASGGRLLAPLPAALYKEHFGIANLLLKHGSDVDIRGAYNRTPLFTASIDGHVDIMRWLLNHGADVNARNGVRRTPLHIAAAGMHPEAVQVLLEHNADVDSRNDDGKTPLRDTISHSSYLEWVGKCIDIVQRLLEHGADPNARDHNHSTLLHEASSNGLLEVARLLLSYGANVDEKDGKGRTPFKVASLEGQHEMTKLLLEHGAVVQP
ncbi:hypothetical protein EDB89DRAFT_2073079 [Lactarius sanguifluus]|nr:hypothetical protein EDB89DRAFT_2073079 [Lactarius sanguifluus]